jgi:RNA polymerase sigma factor (sigma-70 family)
MVIPFEQAVEQHGVVVLRVCRAVLGTGPEADDAWSETFLAALQAWPSLDPDTNLEAWLVRVAQRKAIDIIRARSRAGATADTVPEPASTRDDPAQIDFDLWPAVAALPERQRLAVTYHYAAGFPHTETAQLIGGTPEAVRRAASDGIRTLRQGYAAQLIPKGASQ